MKRFRFVSLATIAIVMLCITILNIKCKKTRQPEIEKVFENSMNQLLDAVASPPELVIQNGHLGPINAVDFSQDGRLIASGGADGRIIIWNSSTGELIRSIDAVPPSDLKDNISKNINSVDFSPDGKTVVSGNWDGTIKLWDANTGKLKNSMLADAYGDTHAVFSPDGRLIASGSDGGVTILWAAEEGKRLFEFYYEDFLEPRNVVTALSFSPNGKIVAIGYGKGLVRLCSTTSGRLLHVIDYDADRDNPESDYNPDSISSISFSPDSRTIAIGRSNSGEFGLWSTNSGKLLQSFGESEFQIYDTDEHGEVLAVANAITTLAFSSDGNLIAAGSEDGNVYLWEASTGKRERIFKFSSRETPQSAVISPSGKFIPAVGSYGQ